MKLQSIIWLPLAILLAGCGESASDRAAREARDAEDMRLLLGALQGGAQRPVQPNVNLDFEWQNRQQELRAMQSQQRWNVYDASGNRVGRIEPNYSPYP
ncbi:MAG: hypothetical protein MUE94_08370 [Verrucomicrobia bacterium]|jgi:hypothetical protein|nr:hypothetical protein [Verrucomicrobiota bacterium]